MRDKASVAVGAFLVSILVADFSSPASAHVSEAPGQSGSAPSSGAAASSAAAGDQSAKTVAPIESADIKAPKAGLAEIVVTAEKRSTNLQHTPIAVTAFSGATLAQAQIRTVSDIQALVPGLKVGASGGYAQVAIRGIGISNFTPGAESAVAVNLNGVFISRPIAQLTGLYDVSSLEVLRGPQGTLYGRNATAGSINIASNMPTEALSGYGRVTTGNYGLIRVEGAVGLGVIDDKLLVRVAGFMERRDGYGKNIVTGNGVDDKKAYGARATVLARPTDNLKATLIAEYYHEHDDSAPAHYVGAAGLSRLTGALGVPPLFAQLVGYSASGYDIANAVDPRFRLRTLALTGTIDWKLGELGLRAITGYRKQHSLVFQPIDGGVPFNGYYVSGEPAHQISQEVQARFDRGRLHATAGVYYFNETDPADPSLASLSTTAISRSFGTPLASPQYFVDFVELAGTIKTNAKAAYTQETYDLTDRLSLTAGVRYSHERKNFDQQFGFNLFQPVVWYGTLPPVVQQPGQTFTSTDPKFGIQYQLTPRTLIYATYAKGFKSGSFDTGIAPSTGFRPERLTDYEGGIKTTQLDNRLRINLSGFYYDYKNLQVLQLIGVSVTTTNAAAARNYGVEAEISAVPIPALELNLNATYLHARYKNYNGSDAALPLLSTINFSGNHLDNAPAFTAYGSAQYTWQLAQGSIAFKAEVDYTTRVYYSPANIILEGQRAFAKGNAFLTYRSSQRWYATAFIRNVTDKRTKLSALVQAPQLGNPVNSTLAPPRTFGVELGYDF